jgi:hypothetical protein
MTTRDHTRRDRVSHPNRTALAGDVGNPTSFRVLMRDPCGSAGLPHAFDTEVAVAEVDEVDGEVDGPEAEKPEIEEPEAGASEPDAG